VKPTTGCAPRPVVAAGPYRRNISGPGKPVGDVHVERCRVIFDWSDRRLELRLSGRRGVRRRRCFMTGSPSLGAETVRRLDLDRQPTGHPKSRRSSIGRRSYSSGDPSALGSTILQADSIVGLNVLNYAQLIASAISGNCSHRVGHPHAAGADRTPDPRSVHRRSDVPGRWDASTQVSLSRLWRRAVVQPGVGRCARVPHPKQTAVNRIDRPGERSLSTSTLPARFAIPGACRPSPTGCSTCTPSRFLGSRRCRRPPRHDNSRSGHCPHLVDMGSVIRVVYTPNISTALDGFLPPLSKGSII